MTTATSNAARHGGPAAWFRVAAGFCTLAALEMGASAWRIGAGSTRAGEAPQPTLAVFLAISAIVLGAAAISAAKRKLVAGLLVLVAYAIPAMAIYLALSIVTGPSALMVVAMLVLIIAAGFRHAAIRTSTIALIFVVAQSAAAQSPVRGVSPTGTWKGTSRCLVRPSACNDEVVVYRVTRGDTGQPLQLDARKVVKGQEVEMGVLGCQFTTSDARLRCAMPNGTWSFLVRGDSLVGELRLADSTRYRDVRTARAPSSP